MSCVLLYWLLGGSTVDNLHGYLELLVSSSASVVVNTGLLLLVCELFN